MPPPRSYRRGRVQWSARNRELCGLSGRFDFSGLPGKITGQLWIASIESEFMPPGRRSQSALSPSAGEVRLSRKTPHLPSLPPVGLLNGLAALVSSLGLLLDQGAAHLVRHDELDAGRPTTSSASCSVGRSRPDPGGGGGRRRGRGGSSSSSSSSSSSRGRRRRRRREGDGLGSRVAAATCCSSSCSSSLDAAPWAEGESTVVGREGRRSSGVVGTVGGGRSPSPAAPEGSEAG